MTALSDPRRTIGNVIQQGTIEHIDLAAATCRVRVGEIVTGDIPWLAGRSGKTSIWSPPHVGEQVALICPEGEMEAAIALPGLFSDAMPAAGNDARDLIRFEDGAVLSYDAAAHELRFALPGGGKLKIVAPGGVEITGDVKVQGKGSFSDDVAVTGKVTASEDVSGGGKSLKGHLHGGVQGGTATTGAPV